MIDLSKFKSLVRVFRFVKLKSNRCIERLFLKKQKKYESNSNPVRGEKSKGKELIRLIGSLREKFLL